MDSINAAPLSMTELIETLKSLLMDDLDNDNDPISHDPEYRKLLAVVESDGLMIKDVTGDGNCMYHAVIDQLRRLGEKPWTHQALRTCVVNYLRDHDRVQGSGEHLSTFIHSGQCWGDYLDEQSKDGTPGDHLVLLALSEILKKTIKIYSSIGTPVIIGLQYTGDIILIGHIHESHYVSLRYIDSYKKKNSEPQYSNSSSDSDQNIQQCRDGINKRRKRRRS
eukprot:UN25859